MRLKQVLKSGGFERRMSGVTEMTAMTQHLKTIFLGLALILVAVNLVQLVPELIRERPIVFAGIKFAGLGDVLKNETRVGYITDLTIEDSGNLAEYSQAQYMLAPVILELNNAQTPFLIVNCSSDAVAFEKLKSLGLQPLKRNQFGVILARNPALGGMFNP
jgi:hypothetical protein